MSEENKNLNDTNTPEPEVIVVETNAADDTADTAVKADAKDAKKAAKKKNKGGLKEFLKSRRARHGSISIAIVAVVIALVIVLNIVSSLLTDRFPDMTIDFTSNNSFALQEDTVDYVSHLEKEVTINILLSKNDFESKGSYFTQAEKLLDKMVSNSNGKVKLKYVDLTSNPTFTSNYPNVTWSSSNNVALVECGENYKALTVDECFEYDSDYYASYQQYMFTGTKIEQAVITAMLNVTTDDKIVVDMVTGNQEQDYSGVTKLLENNAYSVNEITLATQDIDKDAQFVFLYAPAVDLDENAVSKISEWLDNNGKYGRSLVYIPNTDQTDTPNLDSLLAEWGMEVESGIMFETSTDRLISSSSNYSFIVDYTEYYVSGLKNDKIPVVVTDSRSIKITDSNTAHALLQTSTESGVQPFDAKSDWDYKTAITGSALNVAAEGVKTNSDNTSSHVMVFGSYTMFNAGIMQYNSFNNSAYLMNMFNTVANKDDTGITIETKSLDNGELGITDVTTQNMMMVIFVIIIPFGVLILGVVMWLRRRNR